MNKAEVLHPGQVLEDMYLKPLKISRYRLAKETFLDITRISEIVRGKRGITADTALRLARFFGNRPEFWMDLQTQYEMYLGAKEILPVLREIRRYSA